MIQLSNLLKESFVIRWSVLILISLVMAANYYFYDALSPLKSLMETNLGFSSTDYGFVVGFYAFPNTFLLMAILGGIILDKIGIRVTGFAFIIFMCIGAWLTYYGATDYFNAGGPGYRFMDSFFPRFSPSVKMMSLGMLFFGLGAETSIVVISKAMVKWFKGKEIALAFAINLGFARIGTALAFLLGPRLIAPEWTTPIWLAAILITISLLGFIIYMVIDFRFDKQMKAYKAIVPEEKEEEFRLQDIKILLKNTSFLYITALCVAFYAAVFPFLKFAPDFFYNSYGVSIEVSGNIAFWLPIGTVLFTPFFGWLVDKKGKSATMMIYGSIILIIVHLTFAITNFNPYILVFLLGIAFSLVPAAMWPAVAKIVHVNRIGTAYGIMFSLQNLGLFAIPILAGYMLDVTNISLQPGELLNYKPTMFMFSALGIIGLVFAFLLKAHDKTTKYGLELPSNEVKV